MKVGDICYIVINNRSIEEATIVKISGNLYTVKFTNSNKVIRLPKHRLYASIEDTGINIPQSDINQSEERHNRPPMIH